HREPPAEILDSALVHLRIDLRCDRRSGHDADRLATLRPSRRRSLQTSRPASRHFGAYDHGWFANCLQRSPIGVIEIIRMKKLIFLFAALTMAVLASFVTTLAQHASGRPAKDDRDAIERLHQLDVEATLSDKADELANLWDDSAVRNSTRHSSRDRQSPDL